MRGEPPVRMPKYPARDLRDDFAFAASEADVKEYMFENCNGTLLPIRSRVAARYAFADAMLRARDKG